jgi:integrator complex subunit 2
MLLACPVLIVTGEDEKKVISWVKWLAVKCSEMENVGTEGCSFAEQLLLTAIHLHGDRRSAAVKLANSTLGMRIKVSSSSLTKIKHIFTQEVFPTQVVAAHAMKVPITKDLNANISGYLPIHCVFQLLKTRAFSQGRIDVKYWIYQQLCSTASPLHPQLQPLVSQYVSTIVSPLSKTNHSIHDNVFNKPLTEQEILQVFDDKKHYSFTSKLLMLYYVLLYEDSVLSSMKQITLLPNKPKRYSSSLINAIPVKLPLYKAQRQPMSCQGLYPECWSRIDRGSF